MKKLKHLIITPIIMALAAACAPATPMEPTPDVNAIRTSAAYTVVAEITLVAAAFTPTVLPPTETFTPEPIPPTETSAFTTDPTQAALGTPAALCDDYAFDPITVDVTIPDVENVTSVWYTVTLKLFWYNADGSVQSKTSYLMPWMKWVQNGKYWGDYDNVCQAGFYQGP